MYGRYCKLRDVKGYKDADVSRLTGISKATLSDWKRGVSTPKQDKLIKIAECLDTTTNFLLTGEEGAEDIAILDVKLTELDSRLKEYALKLSKLSPEKQELVMKLIDSLE